jgi:hypothetical protein
MLQKYLNKDGSLTLIAQKNLISCESGFQKLSNFYNRKTTNYASVLDSDLFVKITNKEEIIQKGFDCRVKCIISPNFENPYVVEFFKQLNIEREKKYEFEKEDERIYNLQVEACKKEINASEVLQKFIKNKREKGEKDRTIAWKLSSTSRKPNLSNFSIKVILNSMY